MPDRKGTTFAEIQTAADFLVEVPEIEREAALELLAETILDHFGHTDSPGSATDILLGRELPLYIQRFAAAWLLRALTKDASTLDSGNARAQTAALFDRTFSDAYDHCGISSKDQTYEKVNALTDHALRLLGDLEGIVETPPDLVRINAIQEEIQRILSHPASRPMLGQLLPPRVAHKNRVTGLFRVVNDYVGSSGVDLIRAVDAACNACDDYEQEVDSYGGEDVSRILGQLARHLKTSVTEHFLTTEMGKPPRLSFSPISKKYPLRRVDETIAIKVRITNDGTGPALDLQLDRVTSDSCLAIQTSPNSLGTIRAGDSFVFDILAKVVEVSEQSALTAELSSTRLGDRIEHPLNLTIESQKENVDWESVETKEPYSLEAVVSDSELAGRRNELLQLMRLTTVPTVGSGFIYGQRRVGKTSLANAVKNWLQRIPDEDWVVIYTGSGEYISKDASSTLRRMGEILAESLKREIPQMSKVEIPDFSSGIAPLSGLIDQALKHTDKLLFILDEFDELPFELVDRSDTISMALFMPLREMSTKNGCGFLLVGGEGMQQIMTLQGDRLNKFSPVEVDYFTKSEHWRDFSELIRRPVQDWLEISDTALDILYENSAGNPYFAKLLASQLSLEMVERRFTNASEVDMEAAIAKKCPGIVASSFAHFWTDGLIGNSDNMDSIRTIRRSVLIAAGRAFRKSGAMDAQAVWGEFKETDFTRVGEERFHTTLQDFHQRKILVTDERNEIVAKIPLFQSWLMDRGVEELLPTSRESDVLAAKIRQEEEERVKDEEIMSLCEKISHFRYQGSPTLLPSVRRWLNQFDTSYDQRLMFKFLSGVRYYDEILMRIKMREMMSIVERNMEAELLIGREVRHRGTLVSTLDSSISKGGYTYCRLFTDEHNILATNAMPLGVQMEQAFEDRRTQHLLLIDDFAGSGATLVKGLDRALPYLRLANEKGIPITLCAVVGFAHARTYVEEYIAQQELEVEVHFCDTLGSEHQVFSDDSIIFPEPAERARAKQVVESKWSYRGGIGAMGFDDTQAAIVFYGSCPNNTLPILWSDNDEWMPLYPRHASSRRRDEPSVAAN